MPKREKPKIELVVDESYSGGVNSFAGGITWVDPEYDERGGAALERSGGDTSKPSTKETRSPKREAVARALAVLYPAGVPSPAELPNKNLCTAVQNYLKEKKLPLLISEDTIEREAGRK